MYTLLLIFQVLLAIGLIVLILLQHGKGADAGAAFGSGASATVFGARGAGNFMSRASAILATLFFANSLLLSTPLVIGDNAAPSSVTQQVPAPKASPEAAKPEAPADLPDAPETTPAPASASDPGPTSIPDPATTPTAPASPPANDLP